MNYWQVDLSKSLKICPQKFNKFLNVSYLPLTLTTLPWRAYP